MRALIIDDDAGTRGIIKLVLARDFKAEIIEAENGLEGIGHLDVGERFDLVVLDLQMPVMDGVEALEAIRRSSSHPDVPVLILTGEASAEAVKKVLGLGISGYLTKPINLGKLSERIASVHEGGRTPLAEMLAPVDDPIPEPQTTVLVVDADADFRRGIREALGQRARILESETGSHALQVLLADGGANPPAVVVVGPATGVLGGELLATKIRKLPIAAVPRLLYACAEQRVPAAAGSGAFDAVVPKTLSPARLADEVAGLLG